ncbi:cache domain-containing protein [Cobetia sp. 29-18-1]|uniref:cache domain-containing protein n=2 Tax=Cobetia TaxID=204286 RepID=UPI00244C9091|nr:cache domain-containing protein [Cobetia sp. 29-18-1]MDH2297493.1 cache domain-containing protein [Cobetia sp. 29-18-1]
MIKRLRHYFAGSLRRRLLLLTLAPLLALMLALVGLTAYWTTAYTDRQLYMNVRSDLDVASRTLQSQHQRLRDGLEAMRRNLRQLVAPDEQTAQLLPRLVPRLDTMRDTLNADWLRWLPTEQLRQTPGVAALIPQLARGESLDGLDMLSSDSLATLDPALAERARLALRQTPYAQPSARREENRGMLLRALVPILDGEGKLLGALDAGRLLNRDPRLVDEIRDLLYGPGTLPEDGTGTITLFLDDVRIATNVTDASGERALGTRASLEVKRQVIGNGERYINRAFVVRDWFVAAYAPLDSLDGQRIGMIYAGYPQAPYARLYRETLTHISLVLIAVSLLGVLLVWSSIERLMQPIRQIRRVVHAVRDTPSQEGLRIGPLSSLGPAQRHGDELDELAEEFDAMLARLEAHRHEIQLAAQTLEAQVEDRTRDLSAQTATLRERSQALEEHVRLLREARARLLTREKLAALGELTAGIGHEINNPAAVILGHVELIEVILGEQAEPVREEIATIIHQVERIRALVDNLRQYARDPLASNDIGDGNSLTPSLGAPHLSQIHPDEAIHSVEVLVRHALDHHGHQLQHELAATRLIEADRAQLTQVLVNLLINAIEMAPAPDTLCITSRDRDAALAVMNGKPNSRPDTSASMPAPASVPTSATELAPVAGVEIRVIDHGAGVPEHLKSRIFTPFFTTRANGSGIGLSVSSGLITQLGGRLWLEDTPGGGATFCLWLPCIARRHHEDDQGRHLLETLSAGGSSRSP